MGSLGSPIQLNDDDSFAQFYFAQLCSPRESPNVFDIHVDNSLSFDLGQNSLTFYDDTTNKENASPLPLPLITSSSPIDRMLRPPRQLPSTSPPSPTETHIESSLAVDIPQWSNTDAISIIHQVKAGIPIANIVGEKTFEEIQSAVTFLSRTLYTGKQRRWTDKEKQNLISKVHSTSLGIEEVSLPDRSNLACQMQWAIMRNYCGPQWPGKRVEKMLTNLENKVAITKKEKYKRGNLTRQYKALWSIQEQNTINDLVKNKAQLADIYNKFPYKHSVECRVIRLFILRNGNRSRKAAEKSLSDPKSPSYSRMTCSKSKFQDILRVYFTIVMFLVGKVVCPSCNHTFVPVESQNQQEILPIPQKATKAKGKRSVPPNFKTVTRKKARTSLYT